MGLSKIGQVEGGQGLVLDLRCGGHAVNLQRHEGPPVVRQPILATVSVELATRLVHELQ